MIIIDTGPIVAFLDKNDAEHGFVLQQMSQLKAPFFTCESAISEAFFLVRKIPKAKKQLLELLKSGKIKTSFSYADNAAYVHKMIEKYRDLPTSFADACLAVMAENNNRAKIFTVDSDFSIYRNSSGQPFSLISPF